MVIPEEEIVKSAGSPGSFVGISSKIYLMKYLKASHLQPTLLVTLLSFLFAHSFFSYPQATLVALTVFTGQLIVGWSNDLIDTESDRLQNRIEKPLVSGVLTHEQLKLALLIDLPVCALLSLLGPLGVRGGLLHLFGVGCGVAYNSFFKSTIFSVLPYVLAFSALPATPYVAKGLIPPLWIVIVGGVFGVIGHFANVLKDIDQDRAVGITGLPQRLGTRISVLVCVTSLIVITPLIAAQRPSFVILLAIGLVVAMIVLMIKPKQLGFQAIMALALFDVLIMATTS